MKLQKIKHWKSFYNWINRHIMYHTTYGKQQGARSSLEERRQYNGVLRNGKVGRFGLRKVCWKPSGIHKNRVITSSDLTSLVLFAASPFMNALLHHGLQLISWTIISLWNEIILISLRAVSASPHTPLTRVAAFNAVEFEVGKSKCLLAVLVKASCKDFIWRSKIQYLQKKRSKTIHIQRTIDRNKECKR